ncbi:MAG: dihydroorotate dehydrogenase [Planctomycetota bacterium]
MPDWSYQTVFKPLLLRMVPRKAARLALGSMGHLASLPGGGLVIDTMGHMQPDPRLGWQFQDLRFPTRVGLGCGIDPKLLGLGAIARFGIGFAELGPVIDAHQAPGSIVLNPTHESIALGKPEESLTSNELLAKLATAENLPPLLVRIGDDMTASETEAIIRALEGRAHGFVIPWRTACSLQQRCSDSLLLALVDARQDATCQQALEDAIRRNVIDGIRIDAGLPESPAGEQRVLSAAAFDNLADAVGNYRRTMGDSDAAPEPLLIIASGGIHEPTQALQLMDAGADLICIDSGFVFAGPGLPKRVNEATLATQGRAGPEIQRLPTRESWFWSLMMGLGMLLGGAMAIVIAMTRVVMPYDESIVGMTRAELALVNDRLLPFMQHDRVTLAGTMLSVGGLYAALSWFASRRGAHWAQQAIIWSALAGAFTFFLFLGFGYFDPFHAFVTAILSQFLLLTVYAPLAPRQPLHVLDLKNDRDWRRGQWGQLLFVVHGAILIVAGLVIAKIGITSVFVPEDMEFLCTTPDKLLEANPQLVPLVAHDRATFGGMLISCGLVVLLSALWGFRRGEAWLWWTLLTTGGAAYLATITIHLHVGYDSLKHLLPAYGGLALLVTGSVLTRGFLCAGGPRNPQLSGAP